MAFDAIGADVDLVFPQGNLSLVEAVQGALPVVFERQQPECREVPSAVESPAADLSFDEPTPPRLLPPLSGELHKL